jgi:hypothetical protein
MNNYLRPVFFFLAFLSQNDFVRWTEMLPKIGPNFVAGHRTTRKPCFQINSVLAATQGEKMGKYLRIG